AVRAPRVAEPVQRPVVARRVVVVKHHATARHGERLLEDPRVPALVHRHSGNDEGRHATAGAASTTASLRWSSNLDGSVEYTPPAPRAGPMPKRPRSVVMIVTTSFAVIRSSPPRIGIPHAIAMHTSASGQPTTPARQICWNIATAKASRMSRDIEN